MKIECIGPSDAAFDALRSGMKEIAQRATGIFNEGWKHVSIQSVTGLTSSRDGYATCRRSQEVWYHPSKQIFSSTRGEKNIERKVHEEKVTIQFHLCPS